VCKTRWLLFKVTSCCHHHSCQASACTPSAPPAHQSITSAAMDQLDYRSAAMSMFGNQVTSARKSSPVYGMGSGYHNPKVFISQEHEKCNFGRIGPGPAHYTQKNVWTNDSMGRLLESTKNSCPLAKFGTSTRFYTVRDPRMPSGTPGPGHYRV